MSLGRVGRLGCVSRSQEGRACCQQPGGVGAVRAWLLNNTFTDDVQAQDNDTVEELFRLYDKLFYDIPTEGTTNSHTFILQESSKLVEFTKDTEEIQPLLDEIATLREQLLISNQANQEIQQDFFNNVQP